MARSRASYPTIPKSSANWPLTLRKLGLSALVVGGFVAYGVQQHNTTPGSSVVAGASAGSTPTLDTSSTNLNQEPAFTTPLPSRTPPPAVTAQGGLKDGTYTGSSVDAYYGNVQVRAVIQGGRITDVQWLDYPHDRRTSQYINQQADPMLTSEAIQVQNAQVDSISGATFTSEGFVQSLQNALQQAQS